MKLVTATLLLPLVLGLAVQEDDIVFDDVAEETSSIAPVVHRKEHETTKSRDETKGPHNVERFWGVPDATVTVGHAIKLRIPKQAFAGHLHHYEVRSNNRGPLPHWIYWDDAASTFLGVPTRKDVGQHRITVIAHGKHGDVATDSFSINVKPEKLDELKHKDGKSHCGQGEDQTLISIILDAKFDSLKPAKKVETIENLAGFLGLHTSSLSIHPQNGKEGTGSRDTSVILTGPGNVKHRKEKHSTSIQWQVGCEGRLWKHQADLLKELGEQARDGTLAEVVEMPVLLWRVKTDSSSLLRNRREIGSGDGNNDDNDEYDENYDDYDEQYDDEREDDEESDPITELPPRAFVPNASASKGVEEQLPEHPHRHHHGEETIGIKEYGQDIDEEEIVPIVNTRLGSIPNVSYTTTVIVPTTSPPTTASPRVRSTTGATSSMSVETASLPTTITQSISSSTGRQVSITTNLVATSTTPTSSVTTYGPMTILPTIETVQPDEGTDDFAEKTNLIESEFDTPSPASYPMENVTQPPATTPSNPSSTSPQIAIIPTSTIANPSENTDSKSTSAVYVNVTEEESTEPTTELPTSMSQSPSIFITSTTVAPTTTTTQTPIPVTTTTTSTTTTWMPETTFVTTTTEQTTASPTTTTTTTTTTPPPPPPTTTTTTTTTTTQAPTLPAIVTTERIEYGVRNFPPRQDRRLKKIPVTAGKLLSYVIPADTFSDVEDGDTRKLKLSLYLQGSPVKASHWLQLNTATQQVYGLPLEKDVSTWDHDLVASDSEGLNVTERLDIYVQQHKLSRSVNHEFSIYLKIEKRSAFPTNVDWEMKVVESLARLYGDDDSSAITVRSIDITQDQAIFTWTNDSVPRSSECPKDEINRLLHVLIADKDELPSAMLINALAPEISVKRVVYQGIGQCEAMARPEIPKVSTDRPNSRPIPRNQVDHINATVGQLVIYRVPDDAFYDSEDGPTSKLKITLLAKDRTPIPPFNWLQFDTKNQEFYGVPLRQDIGRKEYQLVATDREGLSATDGMIVTVEPAPSMRHNVEFSMTLAIPYESFAHSATKKKAFIEKVRDLFQDKDTSAISLDSIIKGSTVVTWRNTTLPTDYCPNDEIAKLSEVLVKPDKSLTDRIEKIMGDEFPVEQITLTPMGMCLGQLTGVHSPDSISPAAGDSTPVGTSNDDYLITFVLPAIIIAAMLILAGTIACVLYRRRRSGKMSVSEQDDERQSFRSKGIPVIFQDELDEKPDPGNKSPVILKEEKPPLPPPEYQKAEDGADVPMLSKENSEEPYQPPPPFATSRDNNRQNRPKPTPTYRKPPPYVPP